MIDDSPQLLIESVCVYYFLTSTAWQSRMQCGRNYKQQPHHAADRSAVGYLLPPSEPAEPASVRRLRGGIFGGEGGTGGTSTGASNYSGACSGTAVVYCLYIHVHVHHLLMCGTTLLMICHVEQYSLLSFFLLISFMLCIHIYATYLYTIIGFQFKI